MYESQYFWNLHYEIKIDIHKKKIFVHQHIQY